MKSLRTQIYDYMLAFALLLILMLCIMSSGCKEKTDDEVIKGLHRMNHELDSINIRLKRINDENAKTLQILKSTSK